MLTLIFGFGAEEELPYLTLVLLFIHGDSHRGREKSTGCGYIVFFN